ncbi:MAG: AtpZ/AtpI family protein [Methyloceanibacter sp.]|jgi:ATP synthase protein I
MAGAENKSGRHGGRDTENIRQRLDALEGKLVKVQGRYKPPPDVPEARRQAMGQALRLSTELVAGVAIGGFIGWALDRLFDTAPFLMVVFLVLGAAAGIMNVVRTAHSMQGEPLPGEHLRNATDDDDDD